MTRNCTLPLALLGILAALVSAASASDLMSETEASRYGLTRAWHTQVRLDVSRGRLVSIVLDRGVLFVQTDQAILQAIDAETGKTLWTAEVGQRGYPSLWPGLSRRWVAVINGSSLYVLNRTNGKLMWKTELTDTPGSGPAISQERVYVGMVNGLMTFYHLKPAEQWLTRYREIKDQIEKDKLPADRAAALENEHWAILRIDQSAVVPQVCAAGGRIMVPPIITRQNNKEEFVAWATEKGYLCIGYVDRIQQTGLQLRYQLKTDAPMVAQPSYISANASMAGDTGVIFGVSRDGFVHAIQEKDGQHLWRFSSGNPIVEAPAVVGLYVFVTNQLGGMYCLDARNGEQVWWTPDITQFVAASRERVYATDKLGQIRILNARTGAPMGAIPTQNLPIKIANDETDRIYLSNATGLIQCLHEVELTQPLARSMTVADDDMALPEAAKLPPPSPNGAKPAASGGQGTPRPSGGSKPAPRPAAKPKPAADAAGDSGNPFDAP